MGNQPSKAKGDSASTGSKDPGFEQYPSFSRSDTKESTRSLRSQLRSKIPGKDKTESPRSSSAGLAGNGAATASNDKNDKSDVASVKSSVSAKSNGVKSHRGSASSTQRPSIDASARQILAEVDAEPPPSPRLSATLSKGHDPASIAQAQQSGEIDHVSDAPPSGIPPPSSSDKPKEPILIKKDEPIPRVPEADKDGVESGVEINALKTIDLNDMIDRLLQAAYSGKITKTVCLKNAEITAICQASRELFLTQPALLELAPPVKIVGDVHGQYTDLIRMFEMCGFPPDSNFLFLGDYVDRGKQSLETILLLLCYKLKYPENFFLLRGNHECANVTRVYGFYDECKRRCNIKIWKSFIDTFNCLPIAAIVAGKIFCVHGGLSPSLSHMDDIRQIARPTDVPDYGLLNDLLWSDPADMDNDWESNERGVSYCFGKKVIMEFLQRHDFDLVCRAHMVVEDGYEFFSDRILVTVFSAPNYCGEFDNWGAVMSVSAELLCSFELLKPLDSSAMKSHIKKARNRRQNMLNSPVSVQHPITIFFRPCRPSTEGADDFSESSLHTRFADQSRRDARDEWRGAPQRDTYLTSRTWDLEMPRWAGGGTVAFATVFRSPHPSFSRHLNLYPRGLLPEHTYDDTNFFEDDPRMETFRDDMLRMVLARMTDPDFFIDEEVIRENDEQVLTRD